MPAPASDPVERTRLRGRRVGIVAFAAIMTTFTVVCATEILRQVWAPAVIPTGLGCRDGVAGLIHAVGRARHAAAENSGDERAALARFRAALEPQWAIRPALDARCRDDAWATRALRDVDELRYAEEHAVRYETGGLARRRRRVQSLLAELERGKSHPAPGRD